jgi:hypothetical protein
MENTLPEQRLCVLCLKNKSETQNNAIKYVQDVCCSICMDSFNFRKKPYSCDFDFDAFITVRSDKT